jgi:hypothetical protein
MLDIMIMRLDLSSVFEGRLSLCLLGAICKSMSVMGGHLTHGMSRSPRAGRP